MANPYVYEKPLKGQEGFYNRASEITRISSRIAAERPQSVSIVGGPRMGKTSLLNLLGDPTVQSGYLDDPSQYVCPHLFLKEQPVSNPEAFFAQLGAALQACGQEGMKPTYEGFNDLVKQLMQEGRKLVVFLDDFGLVTQNPGFPVDFFSFMRSMANSNDVGYVTTSPAPLQKLCYTQDIEDSPFFNIFTTVNLEPFKQEEARKLVEEPARAAGAPFDAEADWILELAGGAPYLLQLTANLVFEARVNGNAEKDSLADSAFREARKFLELLWKDFSGQEQEVLRAVGAGQKVERRHEYAAESLERRGFLRREGEQYRFGMVLLERYVRENGSGGFWKRLFG